MEGGGAVSSQRAEGGPPSPTASRPSYLRPLLLNKETGHLNVAQPRCFIGRFRCAVPVVVRTPAAATLHAFRARSLADHGALPQLSIDADEQEETAAAAAAAACVVTADPACEDGGTGSSAAPESRTQIVEADMPHAVDMSPSHRVAAGHPSWLGAAGGSQSQLRRRASSCGVSVASNGLAGCPAGRGRRASSDSDKTYLRSRPLFSSASGAAPPPSSVASVRLKGGPDGAVDGVSAANMESLVKSGLHTSLWLAVQGGGLEVRSLANPNQVLARFPRRDPRAVITSLAEICGNRVVAGFADGTVRLYDTVTMQETAAHCVHTAAVTCLLYMPSAPYHSLFLPHDTVPTQSLLLTGSLDGSIAVWRAADMSHLHRLNGSSHSICALGATVTGGYAFSGSDDGTLRMWDVVQGVQLTVSREERANIVVGGRVMESIATAPRPQPLAGSSTVDPVMAGLSSTSAGLCAARKGGQTQTSREGTVSTSKTAASGIHQRLLLSSVSTNTTNLTAAACSPPPLTHHSEVGGRHRSVERCGDIAKGSLNRRVGAHREALVECCAPLQAPPTFGGGDLPSPPTHTPSASPLTAAEDAAFAPTMTDTKLSLFREGSMLVGPGRGISPLHCDLKWDVKDEADRVALRYSSAATGSHPRSSDTGPTTMPYTPRGLQQLIKKRARGLRKQRGDFIVSCPTSETVRECSEAKRTSTPSAARSSVKRNKEGSKKVEKNTLLAAELTQARTQWSMSPLGKRLESWLRRYKQRVLLSAASVDLTQVIFAAYDAVAAVNWPIEYAHDEYVTALTVVEDRLLVSGSRDSTAKVFALPSGQYVRTLSSSRRMPLSSVLYDASVGRLYTAFCDGSIAAYDTHDAELPLLSLTPLSQTIQSCSFVPLRMMPMRRFVWVAALQGEGLRKASPNGSSNNCRHGSRSMVLSVTQFDRTTMAHGPHQTTTGSCVSQPPPCELKAAVSQQLLQQQRALNLADQARRTTDCTLEERDLVDKRLCGLVLERGYSRRQTYAVFARWRQWAWRRALRSRCETAVAVGAESCALALLWRYTQRWLGWARAREKKSASDVLREVQLQGHKVMLLAVRTEVREAHRHLWRSMAAAMGRQHKVTLLACAYSRWREFLRARQVHLRQCVAFNQLLLSMNSSTYTPGSCTVAYMTRAAMRRANRVRALWCLMERTKSSQERANRLDCFDLWRTYARLRRRGAAIAEQNRTPEAVGLFPTVLVEPQPLRRRYFALWQDFALYVTRNERLASERDTLRVEWTALQSGLETPMTVEKLEGKLSAAQSSIDDTKRETKRLEERLEAVSREATMLRSEALLNTLITSYRIPSAVHAAASSLRPTTSMAADLSSTGSMRRGSLASLASMPLSWGCFGGGVATVIGSHTPSVADVDGTEEERLLRQEDKLLCDVSAVLRALKGNTMAYGRDEEMLLAAHALALRLPIHLPSNCAPAKADTAPGRGSQTVAKGRPSSRILPAWSVSNAKCGKPTAVSGLPSSLQERHRLTLSAAGSVSSASPLSGSVVLPTASATMHNTTSTQQMWAAPPAEETYVCLADAFTAVYANLGALLHAAARECGVESVTGCSALARVAADPTGAVNQDNSKVHASASWLARVPLKQRRLMVGEVLKLVTLFDSFTAHSDVPVERPGSISLRGSVNVRSMPLGSLCSRDTAIALVENASVILELVDTTLWPREMKLYRLQDAYAASMAELNNVESLAGDCSAALQKTTAMPLNSPKSSEHGASLSPTLRATHPLAPRQLASGAVQEAGTGMLPQNAMPPGMPDSFGPLSLDQRANQSASSIHSGPLNLTAFASVLEGDPSTRVHSTDDPLNGSLSLEAAWATSPSGGPARLRSHSFSLRSYSGVSTPRTYTPRTATGSVTDTGSRELLVKPYLGFRVHVNRSTQALQRTTTISIREVTSQYVNAEGVGVEGPAQVAGLQVGDQLVRFAGYAVTDLAAFNAVVSRHVHANARLPVVILRSGEQLHRTIVVGSRAAAGV
ncbi:hypothetical protein JKF63_05758 [Porcisia hertigi]|uniref:Guanine nucleotide-binding protein subunit beta-like protein n=1 Tax=Porcisia hertigi TaxID=2761500 RepID=A0A836HWD1_9TRYP|nr:hypothetical protein JKF63_05758 [Porcisia hertigi]